MSRRRPRRSAPTPAQVWRVLHETAREARLARREYAELLRQLAQEKEERERQEKEEREKQEKEWRRVEAEREAKWKAESEKRAAESEKRAAESEKRAAELDKQIRRMSGYGDNRWGRLMEALVEGALAELLRKAGVPIIDVAPRVRSLHSGEWREFDLVAWGNKDVVVVEVKTTLAPAEIPRFTKRMTEFREWRRDYAYGTVRGGLAYLSTNAETAKAVEKAGFYLIRAVGPGARIENSEGFRPRFF